MSLDDTRIPWSVASYLEKTPADYTRRDWEYHEHLQLTEIESVEGEEARWASLFQHAARVRPQVHYDGPPVWGYPS